MQRGAVPGSLSPTSMELPRGGTAMEYWDHTMGPQDRVALRASAVQAVRNGEKKRHVAQRLGITRQTLHNWVAKHRRGGAAALVAKPRGRVRRQVLEPWQEEQVADAIMLLPPSTLSERYTRWTKKAIAEYIETALRHASQHVAGGQPPASVGLRIAQAGAAGFHDQSGPDNAGTGRSRRLEHPNQPIRKRRAARTPSTGAGQPARASSEVASLGAPVRGQPAEEVMHREDETLSWMIRSVPHARHCTGC